MTDQIEQDAVTDRTRYVVDEFFGALEVRDLDRMARLLADDLRVWIIGRLPFSGYCDKTQFLEAVRSLMSVIEGPLTIRVDKVLIEGDKASVLATGRMTTKKGTPYHNDYHLHFETQNGKLKGYREYFDLDILREALEG